MQIEPWVLLPAPRSIHPNGSSFRLSSAVSICLDVNTQETFFSARKLQEAVAARFSWRWNICHENDAQASVARVVFQLNPDLVPHAQGYRIDIGDAEIRIDFRDAAGGYYAICTLEQVISQISLDPPILPGMEIVDWPDFGARGVMLDISRDKVYKMETLFDLVDQLSAWKINQLQLYTEHTFAYKKHEVVWKDASPMTAEEIQTLDAYCKERFIELVPNQNSFGHMERWLKHAEYAPLAEVLGEYCAPWGETKTGPYSLAPLEPGSLALLASLYDELLPNFSSELFNVGCDETFDLGKGKSKTACAELGVGQVYLNFLLEIYKIVKRSGKTMMFWGDIILKYPEFLNQIPRDLIGLIWGYEDNYPFDQQASQFAAAGLRFYVCPGNSTWNSLAGRTDNTLENLKNAAINGLKYGAEGYLLTDWGDNGHWQTWPISFLGFVAGAAMSWCVAANIDAPVTALLNRYVFEDLSEITGNLAYDLGNADHAEQIALPGNGGYFWPLQMSLEQIRSHHRYQPAMFVNGLLRLEELKQKYSGQSRMMQRDADLISCEFALTIRMMEHACLRALFAFGEGDAAGLARDLSEIMEEYRQVWLLRNRPGGLKDSMDRLEKLLVDYR